MPAVSNRKIGAIVDELIILENTFLKYLEHVITAFVISSVFVDI